MTKRITGLLIVVGLIISIIALGQIGTSTVYMDGDTITGLSWIFDTVGNSYRGNESCSYSIYTDGTTTFAKNCMTEKTDFSGTNASIVLNSAIALASDQVFINYGTYNINSEIIGKGYVDIIGTGKNSVILNGTFAGTILNFSGKSGFKLSGFTVMGNSIATTGIKLGYISGSTKPMASFDNIQIKYINGVGIDGGISNLAGGMKDSNFNNMRIIYNTIGIDGFSQGNRWFGGTISNNVIGINYSKWNEMRLYGTIFSGNDIHLYINTTGVPNAFGCYGCWFEGSAIGIIKSNQSSLSAFTAGGINLIDCYFANPGSNYIIDLYNINSVVNIVGGNVDTGTANTSINTSNSAMPIFISGLAKDFTYPFSGTGKYNFVNRTGTRFTNISPVDFGNSATAPTAFGFGDSYANTTSSEPFCKSTAAGTTSWQNSTGNTVVC